MISTNDNVDVSTRTLVSRLHRIAKKHNLEIDEWGDRGYYMNGRWVNGYNHYELEIIAPDGYKFCDTHTILSSLDMSFGEPKREVYLYILSMIENDPPIEECDDEDCDWCSSKGLRGEQ